MMIIMTMMRFVGSLTVQHDTHTQYTIKCERRILCIACVCVRVLGFSWTVYTARIFLYIHSTRYSCAYCVCANSYTWQSASSLLLKHTYTFSLDLLVYITFSPSRSRSHSIWLCLMQVETNIHTHTQARSAALVHAMAHKHTHTHIHSYSCKRLRVSVGHSFIHSISALLKKLLRRVWRA